MESGIDNMFKVDFNTNDFSKEEVLEARKFLNGMIKDSKYSAKHKKCLICGVEGDICDSHTVPRFCLKNIAWDGKINSFNSLLDTQLFDSDSGVKNAGIFRVICRKCDSKLFQDYENNDAYIDKPNNKMLHQIALKTVLRDIYKHESELFLFDSMSDLSHKMYGTDILPFDVTKRAREVDVKECYEILNIIKNCIENDTSCIELVTCDYLDYVVPIAYQGMSAIVTGVNGEMINDMFDYSPDYEVEYFHICILPLKYKTVVLTFILNHYKRCRKFITQFKKISIGERLNLINKIVFLYAEDYFLSKKLPHDVSNRLDNIAQTIPDIFTVNPKSTMNEAVIDYDLRTDFGIPNLLCYDYSIG